MRAGERVLAITNFSLEGRSRKVPNSGKGRFGATPRRARYPNRQSASRRELFFFVAEHFAAQRALIDAGEVLCHCRCEQ